LLAPVIVIFDTLLAAFAFIEWCRLPRDPPKPGLRSLQRRLYQRPTFLELILGRTGESAGIGGRTNRLDAHLAGRSPSPGIDLYPR
jgi:hypothetical protein